jgi:undecaprenyl-phosphate glucose phosphotransferase
VHYFTTLGVFFLVRRFVFILDRHILKRIAMEHIAFVGWSPKIDAVVKSMIAEMGEFQEVVGMIEIPGHATPPGQHPYPVLGSAQDLEKIFEKHSITLVLVDANIVSAQSRKEIVEVMSRELISLKVIPSTIDIWASKLSVRVRAGIPVIGINDLHHDTMINRMLKRTVDLAGAFVGLALGGPIIAVMCVLVYLESPGPVFYRQKRRGLGEKEFDMIKLRSMRRHEPGRTAPGAPRVR